jgi:hypothetical protein
MQEKNLLIGTACIVAILFALGVFVYLSEPIIDLAPVVNGSPYTGKIYKLYMGEIVPIRDGFDIIYTGEYLSISATGSYASQGRLNLDVLGIRSQHFYVGHHEYRIESEVWGRIASDGSDNKWFVTIQEVD